MAEAQWLVAIGGRCGLATVGLVRPTPGQATCCQLWPMAPQQLHDVMPSASAKVCSINAQIIFQKDFCSKSFSNFFYEKGKWLEKFQHANVGWKNETCILKNQMMGKPKF